MQLKDSNKMNIYQILVKETRNYHTIEWTGNLTFISEENGVEFLEISFTNQADLRASQDKSGDSNNTFLYVDYIGTEELLDVKT